MSNKKEFVKDIANIDENFAQWYTDIVLKAELADYTTVKGFIAIRPYGYAIWENIQNYADKRFKENGVKNVSMPVLIPETLLNKEKRTCRRICSRSCVGYNWRSRKIRRKIMYKTYFRNNIFFNVFKMVKFMERFTIFI